MAGVLVGRRILSVAAAFAALAGAAGCRHADEFIWVDAVPKGMNAPQPGYQIAPGDVIGVRVFNQEANSVDRVRVRPDGKISLPFLNDVDAAGVEPPDLARRIEVKLKAFLTTPVVTVTVHERAPLRVSVIGKVGRPGVYDLDHGAGVLHALAAAGGLTPFARDDGLFVLRNGYWADANVPVRIRFRYRDLEAGRLPGAVFLLRSGDVVIAE